VAASKRRRPRRDGLGPTPLVHEGDAICTITDHFSTEEHVVESPFTGILVGVLENPVALPGHPLCHLARTDTETHEEIEAEIARGEFDECSASDGSVPRTTPENPEGPSGVI
jgi:hypothetical protein